jgi:uncharacterized protein YqkB
MKKSILALTALFACTLAFAQNNVTFQVDMSEYTGPAFTMVNLNGGFNGWCGECAIMEDLDNDMVYELTVEDLPEGPIEYKFTTDGWTNEEVFNPGGTCTQTTGQFTNRIHQVTGDETLPVVCWNSCDACGAPPTSANVTFQVDMSEYAGAYTTVNLNGTFNGWCGECAPMADDNGDLIYSIVVNVPVDTIEYKFTVDGWTDEEMLTPGSDCTVSVDVFTNRFFVPSEDVELDVVCWNDCAACGTVIDNIDELSLNDVMTVSNNGTYMTCALKDESLVNEQLMIFDAQGKIILSENLVNMTTNLDISTLSEGVYMLMMATESGRISDRIVIMR